MKTDELPILYIQRLLEEVTLKAVCIVTPELLIEYGNDAMVTLFGFDTIENLTKCLYYDLFADREQFEFLVKKLTQTGTLTGERVLFLRKGGPVFWGRIHCQKHLHNGMYYAYITIKDITEEIKKEEEVKERMMALEKLNAEFDRFIYRASHDLRSPISSIMGLILIMKMDRDPAERNKLINMMETSLQRMDKGIHRLAYYNRNRKEIPRRTKINFGKILSQIKDKVIHHANYTRIEFSNQVQKISIPFYASRFRIELILEELIWNAFDFHDLTKTSLYISVKVVGGEQDVTITVEDNGAGIPKAYVGSVFDMFFRGSTVSKGSGFGLFVVREAVNKLGGTISLSSELGIGTMVALTLPNCKKAKDKPGER